MVKRSEIVVICVAGSALICAAKKCHGFEIYFFGVLPGGALRGQRSLRDLYTATRGAPVGREGRLYRPTGAPRVALKRRANARPPRRAPPRQDILFKETASKPFERFRGHRFADGP